MNFNSGGDLLCSGSDDLEIYVWDWAARRTKTHVDSGHKSNVFQTKFLDLNGDRHIISTSRDGQVRLRMPIISISL